MHTLLDMALDYLALSVSLLGLYFLVRVLLLVKKVSLDVLLARLFLDKRFFAKTLFLVIAASASTTLHVVFMHFDIPLLDSLALLLAMSSLAVLGYEWNSKFEPARKKSRP